MFLFDQFSCCLLFPRLLFVFYVLYTCRLPFQYDQYMRLPRAWDTEFASTVRKRRSVQPAALPISASLIHGLKQIGEGKRNVSDVVLGARRNIMDDTSVGPNWEAMLYLASLGGI